MDAKQASDLYRLAGQLYGQGQYAEALSLLEKLDVAFPGRPEVTAALGRCREALAQSREARGRGTPSKNRVVKAVLVAGGVLGVLAVAYVGLSRGLQSDSAGATADDASPVRVDVATPPPAASVPDIPVDFSFDLEKEVARVLAEIEAGAGVPDITQPQWQRASYQPIIDAARDARAKGLDTIHVPGNITGKDTLRIVYVAGWQTSDDGVVKWGDDEDIVYLTGRTAVREHQTLYVAPGTIVLVAQYTDSTQGGAMPDELRHELHRMYTYYTPKKSDLWQAAHRAPCDQFLARFDIDGTLLARGTAAKPIIFWSDAPRSLDSPYDFTAFRWQEGMMQHVSVTDCMNHGPRSNNALFANSFAGNMLSTCMSGRGWILGSRFGNAGNECVSMLPGYSLVLRYNVFDNEVRTAVAIGEGRSHDIEVTIENNVFARGAAGFLEDTKLAVCQIRQNSFLGPWSEPCLGNSTPYDISIGPNFFNTLDADRIASRILDGNDPRAEAKGRILWSDPLPAPVRMPFKTGIPEVDAVYVEPSRLGVTGR